MKTPEDYFGREIKANIKALPVTIYNADTDEKTVYCQRFEPLKLGSKEHAQFHDAGAMAYEIYIICSNNIIEDINHRIEQTPCAHHSYAPHGAPAWMFPEGAMFDIEWGDIILPVRRRMLALLDAFIAAPKKTTNRIKKQKM